MHVFLLVSKPLEFYFNQGSLSLHYLYTTLGKKTVVSIYDLEVMIWENDTLPVNKYISHFRGTLGLFNALSRTNPFQYLIT